MADFSRYGKAKPVEDGLRARKRTGSIGEQWWSRRFIDVLESSGEQGRMGRGRTYARKGQVMRLKVQPYEVSALVQGSEEEPYEVSVAFTTIDDDGWQDIEEALASRAVFRARLLAGEMPREIEEVFAEFGYELFPASADDLHLMCTCLDHVDPCKHVAAVLYLLAEAFDRDPFLVLAWHGRTREQLLTALRRRPLAEAGADEDFDEPLSAEHFWTPPSGLAKLREQRPAPAVPPGLLLQLVEPPNIKIRRRGLVDVLQPAYEALAQHSAAPEE